MKQILQRLDTGETSLLDIPVPSVSGVRVLVQARASVISAGTERMLVEFGRGNLLDKARSQPDKVRDVLAKVRTDGLSATMEAVQSKLATPLPLGYCNAGVVVDVGSGVSRFRKGDRVVTNGPHAEYVTVPHTLAAAIPGGVSFEAAAFTPVAAIGLQGIRLAQPTLGETVVVYGLGLIGLLCVQLLRANGCVVIGIDQSPARLELARTFGARAIDASSTDVVQQVLDATDGVGADAVLLTLASDSNDPIHASAKMSRKRGRLVLVGVTGLSLSRDEFFKKELSFQVSCSYGPGRYDQGYEDRGVDYPIGFVRWTEQRNFDAVLGAMASGLVDPLPLITHQFDIADAPKAYEVVAGSAPSIGIVLRYPETAAPNGTGAERRIERRPASKTSNATVTAGVIGAGNFAVRTLLPILRSSGVRLRTIASSTGPSAAIAGKQFDFERVTSNLDDIFSDPDINTVFVLTRHDSHASLTRRALESGRHVFVEKPLALLQTDLEELQAIDTQAMLLVGFNRRFAPLARELAGLVGRRSGPLAITMTVNAGAIPRDHWTQDINAGGGRITGEACHFIDLARYLVGSPIKTVTATSASDRAGRAIDDITLLSLTFGDGSVASIQYLATGSKAYPKERVECFCDGRTYGIDNWRRLIRYGSGGPLLNLRSKPDKGHAAEIAAWTNAIRSGGPAPISREEVFEVSSWSIRAGELARRSASDG